MGWDKWISWGRGDSLAVRCTWDRGGDRTCENPCSHRAWIGGNRIGAERFAVSSCAIRSPTPRSYCALRHNFRSPSISLQNFAQLCWSNRYWLGTYRLFCSNRPFNSHQSFFQKHNSYLLIRSNHLRQSLTLIWRMIAWILKTARHFLIWRRSKTITPTALRSWPLELYPAFLKHFNPTKSDPHQIQKITRHRKNNSSIMQRTWLGIGRMCGLLWHP